MDRIYVPTNNPEDWQELLAEPDKHWKIGYSAKSLAYSWQEADGFPSSIQKVFNGSGIPTFHDIELLAAFPEYKVPLPGGVRASQNDVFVLARGDGELVSIMVEGKVSEPFGPTVDEWKQDKSKGKDIRLAYLLKELGLEESTQIDNIRYQLLHRTVSAIIEARKFTAGNALMLVHSFSQDNKWFDDYARFVGLFGVSAKPDSIVFVKNMGGIDLYCGWVKCD